MEYTCNQVALASLRYGIRAVESYEYLVVWRVVEDSVLDSLHFESASVGGEWVATKSYLRACEARSWEAWFLHGDRSGDAV